MPIRAIVAAAAALAIAAGHPAAGEVVLPSGSTAKVPVSRIDEVVVYHKQWEELVVRAVLADPEGASCVERLALIIPVPVDPDLVELEDPAVFTDVKAFDLRRPDGYPPLSEIPGDYDLSPIKREPGKPIFETLNAWLELNGLNTVTDGSLDYYERNDWSFVVLRVSRCNHRSAGMLKPVRICFEGQAISFPLKHVREGRPITASVFLITKNSVDISPLEDFGFTLGSGGDVPNRVKIKRLPHSVESMIRKFGNHRSVFRELTRGRIYFYSAKADFGAGDADPPAWKTDVELPEPRMSPYGIAQNVLAVSAAVLMVVLLSRPRRKSG